MALTTWIGTVTRPNEMAPLQMVRGMSDLRSDPEHHQPMKGTSVTHPPRADRVAGRRTRRLDALSRVPFETAALP
ncbi:hypothetical protein GCM10010216_51820 [Streptomyces flaveolus]|nr:hypothetical protein GCM10010216_51820 [Streptomyces flaveolus]